MAFIFAHPIAGFTSASDASKAGFTANTNYEVAGGRFGDGCFLIDNSATKASIAFPAAAGKIILQFSVKFDGFAALSSFVSFRNNSGTAECLELQTTPAGALRIEDANSSTVATSVGGTLSSGTWHTVVVEADIGNSSGTVRVFVDDMVTPVIDETGVDLDDGAGTGCDIVEWEVDPSADDYRFSQIFIYDTSGSAPWDALIGDKRMYPLLPDGDDTQGWARSAGANNYDLVDDPLSAVSDEDTTYVEATAASKLDLYTMEDIPASTGGIISVIVNLEARKTDAGTEHGPLTMRLNHSGDVTDTASLGALSTTYTERQVAVDDVPGAPAGWTEAQVNALKIGPRIA